jgi:2-C-methyl-D-erythritol 4-phosphate cytidylyltransferase
VRDGMQTAFLELAEQIRTTKPFVFAIGGKERQDSVWNGLQALPEETTIVAIQDGARPCTSPKTISDTVSAANEFGAAVAAQKITDTIKEAGADSIISRNVDRTHLWSVQTPQSFKVEVIRRALGEVLRKNLSVTDDTAACELIGQPVRLIESSAPNPKATTAADLPYIELLLKLKNSR